MKAKAKPAPNVNRRFATPWDWACLLGLFLLTFGYAFRPIFAVDLFWHLALGREIATNGSIPTQDMFSAVHPESAWVQFQWLWEYVAYLTVSNLGLEGLRLAQALLMATSTATVFWTFRRHLPRTLAFTLALLLVILFTDRFRVRPDAMNYVFFAASLPYLVEGWRTWGRKGIVYATVLAALWGNFHGGAALLWIASVGALWTGELLRGPRSSAQFKGLSLTLAGVTAAVALSPTTIPGVSHFVSIFGAATTKIPNPEWDPTWTMLSQGNHLHFALVALAPYVAILVYGWKVFRGAQQSGWKREDWGQHMLCAGYLFLAHHWVRTAFLAILPLYFALRGRNTHPPKLVLFAVIGFLGFTSLHYQVENGRQGPKQFFEMMAFDLEPTVYPVQAADFLEEAGVKGKILNEGKWGGYLIWRRYPDSRLFFDTRHNMREDMWPMLQLSQSLATRTQAMNRAFEAYGTELAVYKDGGEPLNAAPKGWTKLFQAGPEVVYQHQRGSNAASNIARSNSWHSDPKRKDRSPGQQWLQDPWRAARYAETQQKAESLDGIGRALALALNGRRLYRAEIFDKALGHFTEALHAAPGHPTLDLHVAAAEAALGNRAGARHRVLRSWKAGASGLPPWLARDLMPFVAPSP